MNKNILGLAIALFTTVLRAQQIQVQAIKPNPYFLKSEDIFNLQITNPTSQVIDVKIKGIWFFEGQKAVEIQSENTALQPGINTFNSQNPGVINKAYLLKAVDDVETSTGALPAGHYRACIYISCVSPDCNGVGLTILASETDPCYEFTAEQPTPLLLSSQDNGNISDQHRPTFTWIPPMPLGGNLDLNYTLKLVQKNNKQQGCNDAIMRNRPLLKEEDISGQILNYPADIDQLDTGDYAWQVSAQYEGYTVATSEAWCFRVEEKVEKKKIDTFMYVELKKNLDASFIYYKPEDLFCFVYNGSYQNVELDVVILNENTNTEVLPLAEKREESAKKQEDLTLHAFGENKYSINLGDYGLTSGKYIVKIKNNLGIEFFQRIIIK